jgi:cyclopropane fatty-acyl-phospholipid synthase-like methyltransferase
MSLETMDEHIQELRLKKKHYNTTDLDPESTFERHVFHRDFLAHFHRWSHILKVAKKDDIIVDFGCGSANLAEVLYRNRFKPKKYTGFDIREKTIAIAKKKFEKVPWVHLRTADLLDDDLDMGWSSLNADKVVSFEVIEHVGKQNVDTFLQNFRDCGHSDATYYLSTPNYDEKVGAADNHTYDSGDGRGKAVQEFEHLELKHHIEKYFEIADMYGTFASVKDYKKLMNPAELQIYTRLSQYYDSNVVSNLMAPLFPSQSRNTLWVLKQGI